jgi:urea transport system permease protein
MLSLSKHARRSCSNARMLGLVCSVLMGLAMALPAAADQFDDAFAKLGADGFAARIEAVESLAGLGDARAVPALRALADGSLYVRKSDQRLIINQGASALDALTGETLGIFQSSDYDSVAANNRLRVVIRGALGRLVLASPDPERRLEAARGVFRSRSTDNLVPIKQALEVEKDPRVAAQLRLSLGATQLLSADKEDKLQGIALLATTPDKDVRALLMEALAGSAKPGDEEVHAAAQGALAAMDTRLQVLEVAQTVFQGLSLGSVLLLAAMGLAITFGVMGVINMAHGEMVMIGAYTTFVVQQVLRSAAPGMGDWSVILAIPAAFLVAGALGMALERGLIRHLYGRPLETLLMTWGLGMILQQAVRSTFGATNREVSNPSWMSGSFELFGGITITQNRIWIIVFGLAVLFATMAIMRLTNFGLQMRAVTQNRGMAAAMGIRTGRIDALTFGMGSGIAGMAGVALSQIDNVSPNLGTGYIVDSFMVVVFGGVGSLWGTLVGSMLLGLINKALEPYAGAVLGKIFVLVAIILFIQRRPRGLFALKGRAAES